VKAALLAIVAVLFVGCRTPERTPANGTPPASEMPAAQMVASPTTKLESFKPAAGTLVTLGYDDLGSVSGISVDVREFRDAKGMAVRGLLVGISESQYREERAFVDADEIAELLKGIDALLAVQTNPTSFKNFEVRYTTRGDLELTAFNNARGIVSYSVQAGKITKAHQFVETPDIQKLRSIFVAAHTKLTASGRN